MNPKDSTLHMTLPTILKRRAKVAAAKADMTLKEWVILRIRIGLDTRKAS